MWSLHKNDGTKLLPLIWKGGNQEINVNQILEEFKKQITFEGEHLVKPITSTDINKQIILMYISKCGSGKSSSLLNVIKEMGRGIIVVPSLTLQEQYKNDYSGISGISKMYVLKDDGTKLKIGTLIGRKNFICRYLKDGIDRGETLVGDVVVFDKFKISCARKDLPCSRNLKKGDSRIRVGHICPYFVPPPRCKEDFEEWEEKGKIDEIKEMLKCTDIKYYKGISGEYGLFIRDDLSSVCDYYKQFYNYFPEYADVIVMNKWKWEIESKFGRKPVVDIECIDEFDEFLVGLNESIGISNYTMDRLYKVDKKSKSAEEIGIENSKKKLMEIFNFVYEKIRDGDEKSLEYGKGLVDEIANFVDEINDLIYEDKVDVGGSVDSGSEELSEMKYKLEILNRYEDKMTVSTSESAKSIYVNFNVPFPDFILKDLLDKCSKRIIFCSATRLSEETENILYGLNYDRVIYGRRDQPGNLIISSPKHDMISVTYNNWSNEEFRDYYNNLLKYIVAKLSEKGNVLVLTPAKKYTYGLIEWLKKEGANVKVDFSDYYDNVVAESKSGNLITVSYRMKRGVDLRDESCRVIIYAKYPLVDVSDGYIKALFMRFKNKTWEMLNDIAVNDLIQGVCRGLRHDKDWVIFSTPDIKAFDVVQKWWKEQEIIKNN